MTEQTPEAPALETDQETDIDDLVGEEVGDELGLGIDPDTFDEDEEDDQ